MRTATILALIVLAGCSAGDAPPPAAATSVPAASPAETKEFTLLVDEYLEGWAKLHPSIAGGNGIHEHDGMLEDFSATAIASELGWYRDMHARFERIPAASLGPDDRVDRRIVMGVIDGWILDLDVAKSWQRNPMVYASAITSGVHNLMIMESSPPATRMEHITTKLVGVPALLAAGRANLTHAPRILIDRGITMFEGAGKMLDADLPLAFDQPRGAIRDRMLQQAAVARKEIAGFVDFLKKQQRSAIGPLALGAEYVQARYLAEELIDTPLDKMLEIGLQELDLEEQAFVEKARAVDPSRPAMEVWKTVLADHPQRGQLLEATRKVVADLTAFVKEKHIAEIPDGIAVTVAASKPYDHGLASMHASPPLEAVPVESIYYITDAPATASTAEQDKWLQRFNYPSLTITSAHEVMPGHFVHSLYMRETPGKIRRIWIGLNPFPQPSSGQDGWAHYAEQLVIEQGFKADDPRYAMAQLSESMTRIVRLIGGLRLHTQGWTVEQVAKLFEERAHVPPAAALQEATRVVYDPTNGGYFLGKRALLTLREDVRQQMGDKFDLAAFHARVMHNGIAPWWAHRQLLLPGDTGPLIR
jgi:uncharacterized protein (DUF885 family)